MSVLSGSSNAEEYLVDRTGSRRFANVRVELPPLRMIDVASIGKLRAKIFAQATHAFDAWVKRGRRDSDCCWWFDSLEKVLEAHVQVRYEVPDPLKEMVREALVGQPKREVTAREVAQMLDIDTVAKPGKTVQLGLALKALGWTKTERLGGVERVFCWRAPEDFPPYTSNLHIVVEDICRKPPGGTGNSSGSAV